MSTGKVICSSCGLEVYQSVVGAWAHQLHDTPMCKGATASYPDKLDPLIQAGRRQAFEMIRTSFVTMRGDVKNKQQVIQLLNTIWPFIRDAGEPHM